MDSSNNQHKTDQNQPTIETPIVSLPRNQPSGDKTLQDSGDKTTQDSGDETIQNLRNKTSQNLGDKTITDSGDKTTQSLGDKTTQDSGDKTTHESGDKTTQDSGDKTTHESRDKTTQDFGDKTIPCSKDTLIEESLLSTSKTGILSCGEMKTIESVDSSQTNESEKTQCGGTETLSIDDNLQEALIKHIEAKNIPDQSGTQDIEMDESNRSADTNSQSDRSTAGLSQSYCSPEVYDQSEADTETADEQGDDLSSTLINNTDEMKIKTENEDSQKTPEKEIKTESKSTGDEYRPFSTFGKLPPFSIEGLDQQTIIGRFRLLLEVEKIENEIEERVQQLNQHLDGKAGISYPLISVLSAAQ